MRCLLLLLCLSGCAAGALPVGERERAGLAQELQGRMAGAAESCVSAFPSQALEIVDSQTVVLRSGGTIWVNRLMSACPSLRPLDTLIVEVQGSRYCRGDRIRSLPRGSTIPGPLCFLGDFTPYRLPG